MLKAFEWVQANAVPPASVTVRMDFAGLPHVVSGPRAWFSEWAPWPVQWLYVPPCDRQCDPDFRTCHNQSVAARRTESDEIGPSTPTDLKRRWRHSLLSGQTGGFPVETMPPQPSDG